MRGTRLLLVRHGHSMAQLEGFAAGHRGCRGLSEQGREEVHSLATRLTRTGELGEVAALYSSVMPRAVETAELLGEALGSPSQHRDCAFCEFHIGEEADGMPWSEIRETWPVPEEGIDEHWRRTPTTETWAEMTTRVTTAVDRVLERHAGQTIVVATHGGVVANVMGRMLALSTRPEDDERAYLQATNTSLTEFVHEPVPWGAGESSWRLERFNDAAHLASATG